MSINRTVAYNQIYSSFRIDLTSASEPIEAIATPAVDEDFVLASLLQLEFDKEYDDMLKKHENLRNKNSKGKHSVIIRLTFVTNLLIISCTLLRQFQNCPSDY